jgi:diadenosine tetraphosphate (Ap4A) HIT family hydrolase
MNCPFCKIQNPILENEKAYAIYDKNPVNQGHLLIITKRHLNSYFNTTYQEQKALDNLLRKGRNLLLEKFNPDGFNIGINEGEYAGQTIKHLHIHLIPRYKGDIEDPTGGVRGVIPEKRVYKN